MPGYEIFGDAEREEVNQVLETGILMRYGFDAQRKGINKSLELESYISQKLSVPHTQLTTSGTTALCTALAVAGVGAGDEVILPTFTFVASFEAVLALGAVPILVDIDDSLTMSPKAVEAAITPRTKVIMPVHMCGASADIDSLKKICEKHKLLLIEDACQATGATYKGRHLGTFGDMGCFSFDFVKTVTMGEGGAIVTSNPDFATKADAYTDHGHDHKGVDRGADLHPFLGLNYRVSELSSAIGLAQWRKLDQILARQREVKAYIKSALKAEFPQLKFRKLHDEQGDNASFLSFSFETLEQTEQATKAMAQAGVGGVFHYYNNNWHYLRRWFHLKERASLYRLPKEVLDNMPDYSTAQYPQSDDIISRNISTVINLSWSDEDVKDRTQKMINAIKSVFKQ